MTKIVSQLLQLAEKRHTPLGQLWLSAGPLGWKRRPLIRLLLRLHNALMVIYSSK